MEQIPLSLLSGWQNFYVIVGSSAGALTGLQFVVMSLITNIAAPGSMQEVRAFGTPNVVHFCMALLLSATMSAPWPSLANLAYCLMALAAAGLIYSVRVIFHARRADYNPDAEDWCWYVIFPILAYTALTTGAVLLRWRPLQSLFVVAASDLLLLSVGIHNSWDTVTYLAMQRKPESAVK